MQRFVILVCVKVEELCQIYIESIRFCGTMVCVNKHKQCMRLIASLLRIHFLHVVAVGQKKIQHTIGEIRHFRGCCRYQPYRVAISHHCISLCVGRAFLDGCPISVHTGMSYKTNYRPYIPSRSSIFLVLDQSSSTIGDVQQEHPW